MIFVFAAFAAPPSDAPRQVSLQLPEAAALRVRLPLDVVGADPEQLPHRLRLLDEAGEDVAFGLATSLDRDGAASEPLSIVPQAPSAWRTAQAGRPVDRLRLSLSTFRTPVEVRVDGAAPQLVYEIDAPDGRVTQNEVDVPDGPGPFLLELRPYDGDPVDLEGVTAIAVADVAVAEERVALTLGVPLRTEEGRDRYAFDLGGPRAVVGLDVKAEGDLFQRAVMGGVPSEYQSGPSERLGSLIRVLLAGARIDRTNLSFNALRGDRIVVDVAADVGRGLPITSMEARVIGAELLLASVQAGTYTLYVGTQGTPSSDFAAGRVDLLRSATRVDAFDAPVDPNPNWVPRATAEGADGAGSPLMLRNWRWARAIEGSGWVRVVLDRAVLARARADKGDVRVVDGEGRQLPHVLASTGLEDAWETPPFTRTEAGSVSRIVVDLGSDTAPVATVRLRTGKDLFARQVTVLEDRGTLTVPVRRVDWTGGETGRELALSVDRVVGRSLLIEIENGDNPPLPVESVTVTSPRWELRVNVPASGARIVYGAPGAARPSYDLALLGGEVWTMPATPATLGAEETLTPPALGGVDRFVVAGAIGVLVIGLLGLVVRVLRGAEAGG